MRSPGYDDWRIHGYTHNCGDCGKTWQDFEGGCTWCADREEDLEWCYFCGQQYPEDDCTPADKYNDNDGGSICKTCVTKKGV